MGVSSPKVFCRNAAVIVLKMPLIVASDLVRG